MSGPDICQPATRPGLYPSVVCESAADDYRIVLVGSANILYTRAPDNTPYSKARRRTEPLTVFTLDVLLRHEIAVKYLLCFNCSSPGNASTIQLRYGSALRCASCWLDFTTSWR